MIRADYIILAALFLMIGSHSVTQYLIAKHTDPQNVIETGKAVMAVSEQNPIAAFLFQFNKVRLIYSMILAPGLFIGIYWYFRRKLFEKQEILEGYAAMCFVMFMINFFNDTSYLIGFLMR